MPGLEVVTNEIHGNPQVGIRTSGRQLGFNSAEFKLSPNLFIKSKLIGEHLFKGLPAANQSQPSARFQQNFRQLQI